MNYHKITNNDMLNGDGLRVTLWVAGCSHGCPNCQNPQTHDPKSGFEFDQEAMVQLFDMLDQDHISGLTLSGGDPLLPQNRNTVFYIASSVKLWFPNKTVWLYTGYKFEEIDHLSIMKYIDVLVDGKYIEEQNSPSPKWRGSNNQRLINVPKSLEKGEIIELINI